MKDLCQEIAKWRFILGNQDGSWSSWHSLHTKTLDRLTP